MTVPKLTRDPDRHFFGLRSVGRSGPRNPPRIEVLYTSTSLGAVLKLVRHRKLY
jgi:hypothetical protein